MGNLDIINVLRRNSVELSGTLSFTNQPAAEQQNNKSAKSGWQMTYGRSSALYNVSLPFLR